MNAARSVLVWPARCLPHGTVDGRCPTRSLRTTSDMVPCVAQVEGPHSCAAACEGHPQCSGFDYNRALQRCTLRSGPGHDVMFDRDGWQTYWHEQHFRDWRASGRLGFLRRLLFRFFGFLL